MVTAYINMISIMHEEAYEHLNPVASLIYLGNLLAHMFYCSMNTQWDRLHLLKQFSNFIQHFLNDNSRLFNLAEVRLSDVWKIYYHSFELHLIRTLEIQLYQTKNSVPQKCVRNIWNASWISRFYDTFLT